MLPRDELWPGLDLGCIVVGEGVEIERGSKRFEFWLWLGLASTLAARTEPSGVLGREGSGLEPHSLVKLGVLVISLVEEDAGVRKDLVAIVNSEPGSEDGSDELAVIGRPLTMRG